MDRNEVTTAIKEHEGLTYIEVTSTSPAKEVVYTHSAWVNNDPELHHVLLQHSWSLNRRTGHLVTQTPAGPFRVALEAQGDVPDQVSLPRCLAAVVAGGRRILTVQSEPTDYRYEALTVKWDRGTTTLLPPAQESEGRVVSISQVQRPEGHASRRELADARRLAADERRDLAERRATAKHFERLKVAEAREMARSVKQGGKAMRDACMAEAERQRDKAAARGEAWAIQSKRTLAGHAPGKGEAVVQSPRWYRRLCNGKPVLLSLEEAEVNHGQRLRRAQAAFDAFCATVTAPLSRPALRAAWLKQFPAHDWVEWNDPDDEITYTDPLRLEPPKHLTIEAPLADLTDEDRAAVQRFLETGK